MEFGSEITWQQRAAYERLEKIWDVIEQKSRSQTQAAITLTGLSAAGVSLLATNELSFGDAWIAGAAFLVLTGIAALLTQVVALFVGRVAFIDIPGSTDTDVLWDSVINREGQKAFNRLLMELAEATERMKGTTETRAILLDFATIGLSAQAALTIAVLVVASLH